MNSGLFKVNNTLLCPECWKLRFQTSRCHSLFGGEAKLVGPRGAIGCGWPPITPSQLLMNNFIEIPGVVLSINLPMISVDLW